MTRALPGHMPLIMRCHPHIPEEVLSLYSLAAIKHENVPTRQAQACG